MPRIIARIDRMAIKILILSCYAEAPWRHQCHDLLCLVELRRVEVV